MRFTMSAIKQGLCNVFRAAMGILALTVAPVAAETPVPDADPLEWIGVNETSGAAPGYVPDDACARCHGAIFASYQEVGMAKSFARPRAEVLIEDFTQLPFYHSLSQRYYEIDWDGEDLMFRRYQRDAEGRPKTKTSHSLNRVPFHVFAPGAGLAFDSGIAEHGLANLAASLLQLMGYSAPDGYEPSLFAR